MPTPWVDPIRNSGELRICLGQSLGRGWAQVVRDAVPAFNAISATERLGIQFVIGDGNGDVDVAAIDGQHSYSYSGQTFTANVPGADKSGLTQQMIGGGRIGHAFVFLPLAPLMNTPRGQRAAGRPVLLAIVFHELIHATGLRNSDHDLAQFHGSPQPSFGAVPADDRLVVGSGASQIAIPPLAIQSATARLIRENWA